MFAVPPLRQLRVPQAVQPRLAQQGQLEQVRRRWGEPGEFELKGQGQLRAPAEYFEAAGSGGFGCVLTTAIPCVRGQSIAVPPGVRAVSKVYFDTAEATVEWNSLREVERVVDPQHFFTPRAFGVCDVDPAVIPRIRGCGQGRILPRHARQLVMEFGGLDLDKTPVLPVGVLVRILHDTFVPALQAIWNKGLLHADVKPQNMLYNPATGQAYLIDFGLLTPARDFLQAEFIGNPGYYIYPPEWGTFRRLYDMRLHFRPRPLSHAEQQDLWRRLEQIAVTHRSLVPGFRGPGEARVSPAENQAWRDAFAPVIQEAIVRARQGPAALDEQLQRYLPTGDMYGLAASVGFLDSDRKIQYDQYTSRADLAVLFHALAQPDPAQRWTFDATIRYLAELLRKRPRAPPPVRFVGPVLTSGLALPIPPQPAVHQAPPPRRLSIGPFAAAPPPLPPPPPPPPPPLRTDLIRQEEQRRVLEDLFGPAMMQIDTELEEAEEEQKGGSKLSQRLSDTPDFLRPPAQRRRRLSTGAYAARGGAYVTPILSADPTDPLPTANPRSRSRTQRLGFPV